MKFSIPSPPRTIMEVYKMLPEGTLAELINGHIYMSPTPIPRHQRFVGKLYRIVHQYIELKKLGELILSPSDVYLDQEANAVHPDLFFIAKDNPMLKQEDEPFHGIPDLVIEVLSKGNKNYHQITKKELYQKFGVKEYWIVDPSTYEAFVYTLQNNTYILSGQNHNKIFSPLFQHEFEF